MRSEHPHSLSKIHALGTPSAVVAASVSLVPLPFVEFLTASVIVLAVGCRTILADIRPWISPRFFVGVLLLALTTPLISWAVVDRAEMSRLYWLPVALVCSVAVLLWACVTIGFRRGLLHALPGAAVYDLLTRAEYGNLWKYALSVWVVVAAVVMVAHSRLAIRLLVYFSMIIVSVSFQTRNIVGLMIAVIICDVLLRYIRTRSLRFVIGVGLLLVGTAGSLTLALAGTLGDAIEETTTQQAGGGLTQLISNARPEARGNWELVSEDWLRPPGSAELTAEQGSVIRNSLMASGWDPYSQRADVELISKVELHSVAATSWYHLGTVGLLLTALAAVLSLAALAYAVAFSTPMTAIATFASGRLLWDVFFSPVSDVRFWPVYIAVMLLSIAAAREVRADDISDSGGQGRRGEYWRLSFQSAPSARR